ncbi:class I SAM-dependent methyltransferase [Streptosporangium sp. KLBMP 9127]|nr:nodulation S family protein [Streptosporangium sp. KLBMP 9127]
MTRLREIPDMMHRVLFKSLSLLAPGKQGAVLGRYFDWWHRRPDPWSLSSDAYERYKYTTTLSQVPGRPYRKILDVGCSEGVFTELLAMTYPEAEVTGVDVSARALGRARDRAGGRARFIESDILTHSSKERFDLVFCAETLYYLGRDERLRLASTRLSDLLEPGGLLVLVHPWPEARRLHGYLDSNPAVSRIAEQVDEIEQRPFAVSLYQAPLGTVS